MVWTICTRRNNKKLTQAQPAKSCGVSQQTIQAIESGKRNPSIKLAFRLASVLDCSVEELVAK